VQDQTQGAFSAADRTRGKPESSSAPAQRWLARIEASERTPWLLGAASFAETFIVPIPIEVILLPLMLLRRQRPWFYALIATLGCTAGAIVVYAAAFYFFEQWAPWLLETLQWTEEYDTFARYFDRYGFVPIVAVGIAPIPFQIAMLVAGAAGYPFFPFVAAATLARGIRYFGLAALVRAFGEQAAWWWQQNKRATALAAAAAIALLFGALRLVEHLL
jgi:membrane protein YqaA with SNARE-associated domain